MTATTAFRALALQTRCRTVHGSASRTEARDLMKRSIERIAEQISASVRFIGPDTKLVVLGEYALTGHPVGEPIDVWKDLAALDPDGEEQRALAAIAKDTGIYLSVNAYENDEHFPGLYFQSCLIFDPSGSTILRYRRLNSVMTPTPHDVWDRYLEIYGLDGVFPVARTPIGNLACVASEEILFPELARCLALRGAEVILHSTSEVASPALTPKEIARRARAIENLCYVVSANSAGIEGSPIPAESTDGGSKIVDFEGRVLVEAALGESMAAHAELDLAALRRARHRGGMGNLVSRNRLDAYMPVYAQAPRHQANGLADGTIPDRAWFLAAQRATIESLQRNGAIE